MALDDSTHGYTGLVDGGVLTYLGAEALSCSSRYAAVLNQGD